jgi:hypothetical protein
MQPGPGNFREQINNMPDGEVYQKTAQDRVVILNPRGWYFQPIIAPDWVDLRIGFFLSLTDAVNDDLTFGTPGAGDLSETIANPGTLDVADRYLLGVGGQARPGTFDFIGFTNMGQKFPDSTGDTTLVSSDAGVGTSNTNFWRIGNSSNNTWAAAIVDANINYAVSPDNLQQHFPQNAATVAAGYAVMFGLQLLRDNAQSKTIRCNIKSSAKSSDMLYSNVPTKELLHATMENWPASQQLGPVTLSAVPTYFYFYWPFRKSRLRIHSLGVVKAE